MCTCLFARILCCHVHLPLRPHLHLCLRACTFQEPSSPSIMSPVSAESFHSRLLARLHFHGNKHEFFAKTKFAGCLREAEHDELFKSCSWRTLVAGALERDLLTFKRHILTLSSAGETVFRQGDSTASGLIMVVEGALGVYGARQQGSGGGAGEAGSDEGEGKK